MMGSAKTFPRRAADGLSGTGLVTALSFQFELLMQNLQRLVLQLTFLFQFGKFPLLGFQHVAEPLPLCLFLR